MVVARILIKTKEHKVVNIVVNVNIGGDVFSIKLVEDRYGSLHWIKSRKKNHEEAKLESRNSAGEDEDSNFPIEDVEESRAAMFNILENSDGSVQNISTDTLRKLLSRPFILLSGPTS
jgi:hypothetical protein